MYFLKLPLSYWTIPNMIGRLLKGILYFPISLRPTLDRFEGLLPKVLKNNPNIVSFSQVKIWICEMYALCNFNIKLLIYDF